ncbi:DUF1489 family protein [Thermaurantiacus sp.]
MPLHLTRVAYACQTLEEIAEARDRFAITLPDGTRATRISSRRTPRRDLTGGSLFWIIAHRLVARQAILGIAQGPERDGCEMFLSLDLIPVEPIAFRSHQGWRYLAQDLAPPDLQPDTAALPHSLRRELATLGLG